MALPPPTNIFAGWRPPITSSGQQFKSGRTLPVKFLVVDEDGNPVTSGLNVAVTVGGSSPVTAVLDDATIGQWKAEVKLVGSGSQAVIITGNILNVTPLSIQVKP